MKKLPDKIAICGMCPYFQPSWQYGEGNCILFLQAGYVPRLYIQSMPVDCPLDEA